MTAHPTDDTTNLAHQTLDRYGRLALSRAAGEAAAAAQKGDQEKRTKWANVLSYLRQTTLPANCSAAV
ncbi:MAG: hypothetical protein AB7E52_09445 [Bdellovibrionales bacterium]